MKTVSQIINYTALCHFEDEDWHKVLKYCRDNFKGAKISKAKNPVSDSNYFMFLEWIETGYGAGDIVIYDRAPAMIGYSTPEKTVIVARLAPDDSPFPGKLIVQDLEVDPRIIDNTRAAGEEEEIKLRRALFDQKLRFNPTTRKFGKVYTPKKFSYVVLENPHTGVRNTGIFLDSDDSTYFFLAYEENGGIRYNCKIETQCTPLWMAEKKDSSRLDKALAKDKKSFNTRINEIIPMPLKGRENVYWYLNDRFDIVQDKDNGNAKHRERLDVGNYFWDYEKALMFMSVVRKIRKGGL